MKKKIKIAIVIALTAILVLVGLVWFGYRKPRTAWQYAQSYLGYSKPDANADSKIVFLGDSITIRENWNVLFGISDIYNAGIAGNTTDDVLARLDAVVSARPQKLFLMIGINDLLNGKDVDYVMRNYKTIISRIKTASPSTTIYMQSVLPVNNKILKSETADSQEIITLNNEISTIADGKMIFFIDLYPSFCGLDNQLYKQYTWDGLHPNSYGYAVWKQLVVQYVE